MGARAEIVLPGSEPETVTHGRHERSVLLPAAPRRPVGTVRELIDDAEAWERVVEAAGSQGHPMFSPDPAPRLAGMLSRDLDRPVSTVPGAATVHGFVPGLEGVRRALEEAVRGEA